MAAIRAKTKLTGILKVIQERLKRIFDTVTDAFTNLDHDQSDAISLVELQRGFKRVGNSNPHGTHSHSHSRSNNHNHNRDHNRNPCTLEALETNSKTLKQESKHL